MKCSLNLTPVNAESEASIVPEVTLPPSLKKLPPVARSLIAKAEHANIVMTVRKVTVGKSRVGCILFRWNGMKCFGNLRVILEATVEPVDHLLAGLNRNVASQPKKDRQRPAGGRKWKGTRVDSTGARESNE